MLEFFQNKKNKNKKEKKRKLLCMEDGKDKQPKEAERFFFFFFNLKKKNLNEAKLQKDVQSSKYPVRKPKIRTPRKSLLTTNQQPVGKASLPNILRNEDLFYEKSCYFYSIIRPELSAILSSKTSTPSIIFQYNKNNIKIIKCI